MSKTTVWLACYKGRTEHRGIAQLADWLTRKITRGSYSHCELAVKHGERVTFVTLHHCAIAVYAER